jgi:hypothetical protein
MLNSVVSEPSPATQRAAGRNADTFSIPEHQKHRVRILLTDNPVPLAASQFLPSGSIAPQKV